MVVSRHLVLLWVALIVLLVRSLRIGPVLSSICCLLMSVVLSSSWGLAVVVAVLLVHNWGTGWRTRRLSSGECLLSGPLGSLGYGSNTAHSCRFGPGLLGKLSLLVHPQVFHILVETVGENICLATPGRDLVALVLGVDITTAIIRGKAASGTAHSCLSWWSSPILLRVDQALPSLDLLALLVQLLFFSLSLLPIFVRNPGHDAAMSLSSLRLIFILSLVMLGKLLLHLFLPLLYK